MEIKCSETQVTQTYRIFPKDLNSYHTLFGGEILSQLDVTCSIAVARYCHAKAFTIGVDHMEFLQPLTIDHALCIEAFVSGHGTRSIETFAHLYGEDLNTGHRILASICTMSYALAPDCNIELPTLIPDTPLAQRICDGYNDRRTWTQQFLGQTQDIKAQLGRQYEH